MKVLPMNEWTAWDEIVPALKERICIYDGGAFIRDDWACKYINARIDMRTGHMILTPGNCPVPGTSRHE